MLLICEGIVLELSSLHHTYDCWEDVRGIWNARRFRDGKAATIQAQKTEHAMLRAHNYGTGPHMWGLNLAEQPICCSKVLQ